MFEIHFIVAIDLVNIVQGWAQGMKKHPEVKM